LALRWVQKYIDAFGGDPTKVTMYVYRDLIALSFLSQFSFLLSAGENQPERYLSLYT